MARSRRFVPSPLGLLESRVVLSHMAVTHHAAAHPAVKPAHAAHSLPSGISVDGTTLTKYSDGRVETTDESVQFTGPTSYTVNKIIRSGNELLEVDQEKATVANGTTHFTTDITLSTVGHQTETGTDVLTHSLGTIGADGTVTAGIGPITTETFDHVLTQAGLGTQETKGTQVSGTLDGKSIAVTNQVVTNFDGSRDLVHIVTRPNAKGAAVMTTTTAHANGTVTTLVATTSVSSAVLY